MKVRQAIVMVGGMGTRLRPLTENRPKPMLSVADRPCIWYLLRSLARAGVEEVILACGYKPGMMEALGDGSDLGIKIIYSYEDTPMGTAGSMKLAEDRLDDVFIAAYGDIFADIDVSEEVRIHFDNKADITVALTAVEDPTQFGIARVDETGRILEFKEKPKPEEVFSNLINAGIYVMNRSVLDKVPKDTFFDVSKELIPQVMAEGRIQAYQLEGVWMDVGRPHDLLEANLLVAEREYRLKRFDSAVECCTKGSFYLGEGAFIGNSKAKSTVISKGSKVVDSDLDRVLLLDDCEVSGATIVNSILGVGCRVGKGAKISNCVLADRTVVEEGSNLEGDRIV